MLSIRPVLSMDRIPSTSSRPVSALPKTSRKSQRVASKSSSEDETKLLRHVYFLLGAYRKAHELSIKVKQKNDLVEATRPHMNKLSKIVAQMSKPTDSISERDRLSRDEIFSMMQNLNTELVSELSALYQSTSEEDDDHEDP